MTQKIEQFLNLKVKQYHNKSFIANDPLLVPHRFSLPQDIEIAGFFAAIFAWGNRTTIISKSIAFLALMDNAPYQFVKNFSEKDLAPFQHFVHRTFNGIDAMYLLEFLQFHYTKHNSLETAFSGFISDKHLNVQLALEGFHNYVFSLPHAIKRTQKHISTPAKNSACKRLNMFLRWMVRKDKHGVDFGIWQQIKMNQLICPFDVHVQQVATKLGLLPKGMVGWKAAVYLTEQLKQFNAQDPVVYDFALFNLGVNEYFEGA
jgi:uncharacterized protein (TIGR02757 family)